MKFGKRIRKELSPSLLWGSVDYKALKKIAKTIRLIPRQPAAAPNHNGLGGEISDINDKVDKFFARVEVEKEKVRPPQFLPPSPAPPLITSSRPHACICLPSAVWGQPVPVLEIYRRVKRGSDL